MKTQLIKLKDKTQLIKLKDKFILVSDEEIKVGDKFLHSSHGVSGIYQAKSIVPESIITTTDIGYRIIYSKKIIAGIPSLPQIDFSLLKEEDCKTIGFIDIEKLALEKYPEDWREDDGCNYIHNIWDINKQYRDEWIKGFSVAQSINKEFSLEDMWDCWYAAILYDAPIGSDSGIDFNSFIQSLTSWNVEVEMECPLCRLLPDDTLHRECNQKFIQPKTTNNSIKITKIL